VINLLPPELKTGYRYAQRNVGLRKWVVIFLVALVGLGGIATYGLLTLRQSSTDYTNQIAAAQANLQKEQFTATQQKVKDISDNFQLVVKVLGQEVLFSQLLKQIATAIPADTNLTGLNINQTQGGIDISADAANYQAATQVQVNLADPNNKIFSKADLVNISCTSGDSATANSQYPCDVTVRALFATNNPFLFINSKDPTP
jgi:Tfp pilus assembly protein PilN